VILLSFCASCTTHALGTAASYITTRTFLPVPSLQRTLPLLSLGNQILVVLNQTEGSTLPRHLALLYLSLPASPLPFQSCKTL
jgi:hypothetical protein